MYAYMYVCTYVLRTYVCIYVCTCVCMYVRICMYVCMYEEVLISSQPDQEGKSYSDQTRDLFNILHTKLNTLLSPLL